jgi:enoyl-[acyl-carrier-protein] reductase (NADH)
MKYSKLLKNHYKHLATKRMCTSQDVSTALLFLLSKYFSYLTGVNLSIDGGFTV